MSFHIQFETQVTSYGEGKEILVYAYYDNHQIGSCGCFYHPENADLTIGERNRLFTVHASYRGMGIGESLGNKLIETAYQMSFPIEPEMFTLAVKPRNVPMIRLADKLHFWVDLTLSNKNTLTFIRPFVRK